MSPNRLIYDDRCAFCCAAVRHLTRQQSNLPLKIVGLSRIGPHHDLNYLSRDRLRAEIHLVTEDGAVLAGAAALGRVAGMIPRYRWLSFIMSLPIIRHLADMIYRAIARRRHHLTPLITLGKKND